MYNLIIGNNYILRETYFLKEGFVMATKKTTTAAETTAAKTTADTAAEKKTAAKKTAPAKPVGKKAPAKKPIKKFPSKPVVTKAETKVNFFVEYGGVQVSVDEVIKNVKATYCKDAKEISVYLKPEESKAYFVADGVAEEMDVYFC